MDEIDAAVRSHLVEFFETVLRDVEHEVHIHTHRECVFVSVSVSVSVMF